MSLEPLLQSSVTVQIHAFSAIAAFILGVIQFIAPKGALPHKMIGAVWILLMFSIAISSIFIRPSLYPGLPFTQWFSFIHLFTVLTLYGAIGGSMRLLRGGPKLKQHAHAFAGIFIGGLVIAGGFAFLPGRIMHQVVFGAG